MRMRRVRERAIGFMAALAMAAGFGVASVPAGDRSDQFRSVAVSNSIMKSKHDAAKNALNS